MNTTIRIAGVIRESIVDGPGIRFVVFVQGCPHRCPGCHNPQSHDFAGGYEISIEKILEEIEKNPLLQGVTFSGGEPFCQPGPLVELGKKIRAMGLGIIVYSGYTFEQLMAMSLEQPEILELMRQCDVLIDGQFLAEKKSLELEFKGSSNQRTIDLRQSLREGRAVEIRLHAS